MVDSRDSRLDTTPFPLPGACAFEQLELPVELPPERVRYLYHLYGAATRDVLAPVLERPELLEPIHPDGDDLAAQVPYAAQREWALTAEDVIRRRTMLGYRGLADDATTARVAELL